MPSYSAKSFISKSKLAIEFISCTAIISASIVSIISLSKETVVLPSRGKFSIFQVTISSVLLLRTDKQLEYFPATGSDGISGSSSIGGVFLINGVISSWQAINVTTNSTAKILFIIYLISLKQYKPGSDRYSHLH
jgi:hypothetical protein